MPCPTGPKEASGGALNAVTRATAATLLREAQRPIGIHNGYSAPTGAANQGLQSAWMLFWYSVHTNDKEDNQ